MAAKITLLKKLSLASLIGKIEKPKGPTALYRVIGTVIGVKTGTSTYGGWTALMGDFEAINLDSGEMYASSKAFLPEPALSMLAAASMKSPGGVEFAVEVGVKPANNAFGYEYTVRPLIDSAPTDALKALRGVAFADVKAIAAPAKK
jgi:hypothetical protein